MRLVGVDRERGHRRSVSPAVMQAPKRRARHQLRISPRARIVAALLIVALARQLILVVATPPFQGHDEVAHLGYIWLLDHVGRLPTLADRLPETLSPYATFTVNWPALYTANHPPLYYLIAWPVYRFAGSPVELDGFLRALYLLRLLAIPPYLLTIWLAYLLATTIFPADDFLALTVPAFVAFQPQFSYEGAIVNNDGLSLAFGALLLYLCARALRDGLPWPRAAALGLALGLGLLTKATLTVFLPLVAGVAAWCHRPRSWRALRTGSYWRGLAGVAPALLLPLLVAAPWYLFLHRTYGDISAFRALQDLQADWNAPIGTFGELLRSRAFHADRLREYWGEFGWKRIPLTPWEIRAIEVAIALAALGLLVGLARVWRGWRGGTIAVEPYQVAGVALALTANLLLYGAMIYFGTMFKLSQARYFFPVGPATGLLLLLGLRGLLATALLRPAAAAVIAVVAAFDFFLITQLVIPYAYL